MASKTNKYTIQAETKGFKKAEGQTKKLGGGMKSLAKSVGGVALAYFSAQGLVSGLKAVIKLAGEQELAEKKLATAFRGNTTGLKAYARQLQQTTRFGDEAVMGVMTIISAFNKDEDAIRSLTKATLDLAEGTGMDLKSAGDLVSKSIGSSTNALSRYGIEVVGAVGSTARLDSMLGNISDKFEGQASASADTMTGSVAQMHNALGDMGETIGTIISPMIVEFAGNIKQGAEMVGRFFAELTETDLETTIRELEDLGIATESLLVLKNIQLDKEIRKLNSELEKSSSTQKSNVEIEERLRAIQEERGNLLVEQGNIEANGSLEKEKQFNTMQRQLEIARSGMDVAGLNLDTIEGEAIQRERSAMASKNLKQSLDENVKAEVDRYALIQQEMGVLEQELEGLTEVAEIVAELNRLEAQRVELKKQGNEEGGGDAELTGLQELQIVYDEILAKRLIDNEAKIEQMALDLALKDGVDKITQSYIDQAKAILTTGEVEKATTAQKLASMSQLTGGLSKLAGEHKQGALVAKRLAQSTAVIDTWAGANKALASAPPPWNFIAMAGVIASGMANVANIESQTMATGGFISGNSHANGGVNINAEGGEFMMRKSAVESIGVESLSAMNEGGGGGITLNISAPLVDDTIIDTIVPAIDRARREGLA